MNIKDPEVRRLAMALAAQRNTTATAAVREALREALARHEESRAGIAARLLVLSAVSREIAGPLLTDDNLYDEQGLPR